MVFDSHTHAWGPNVDDHPWKTDSMIQLARDLPVPDVYSAEELLAGMDDIGIDEAVVVGLPLPEWHDNWYNAKIAEEYDRLYSIILADPFQENAAEKLQDEASHEDVLGYRLAPVYPRDGMYEVDPAETVQSDWLVDTIAEEAFWEATAETGSMVTLLVHIGQLDQVLQLVEEYPELNYVIDHLGRTDADVPLEDEEFRQFEELAKYENVLVKASALPFLSRSEYPYEDLEEYVRWMLDTFGRKRVAWGSDYPFVSSVGAEYEETLTCLEHFDSLSSSDHKWLTERTFKRFADIK